MPMNVQEFDNFAQQQVANAAGMSSLTNPNGENSMRLLLNYFDRYNDKQLDSPIMLALLQSIIQRGFDLDARDYNSVQSQVERLMAAGMSRTQALLTATAGEATSTQVADLGTAGQNAVGNRFQLGQSIYEGISSLGNTLTSFLGNYGNIYTMAGDALVQPIGEEIYSWINKGINVPDLARADAQHFKQWCLGTLKDEEGNTIVPPDEAKALINSKQWSKMASRPSGWTAFQRYFNANYSTRGYHEDYKDAERFRHLADMDLSAKAFQNIVAQEQAMRSTLESSKLALQGVRLDMSAPDSPFSFVVGKNGEMIYQDGILFDENGNLDVENLPDLLAAFNNDCATILATAEFQGSTEYIEATRQRMLSDEKAKRFMNELDVIDKQLDIQLHKTSNAVAAENLKQSELTTEVADYNADYAHREHDLFMTGDYNTEYHDKLRNLKQYIYSTRLYWKKLQSGDSRSFFENIGAVAGEFTSHFFRK